MKLSRSLCKIAIFFCCNSTTQQHKLLPQKINIFSHFYFAFFFSLSLFLLLFSNQITDCCSKTETEKTKCRNVKDLSGDNKSLSSSSQQQQQKQQQAANSNILIWNLAIHSLAVLSLLLPSVVKAGKEGDRGGREVLVINPRIMLKPN